MSDQTIDTRSRDGDKSDRKLTATATYAFGMTAAGGTATALYVMGCLKGHQVYWPDDALALWWISLLGPAAHALYRRFNAWAGVPPTQQTT